MDRPPLTITIASNEGWETVRFAYEAVRDQAEAHDAEVILVDGSRGARDPDAAELGPTTRWIDMPGSDISEMRARAYKEARGAVICMTEDHVKAAPDWAQQILRAHAEHPEAAAIGGAVRNGTPNEGMDWASFYAGHAPFLEPLANGPAEYLSGINVSYKREPLLKALDRIGGTRAIETLINEEIKADGGALFADDRLLVSHFQSRGVVGTTALHYYAGRHFEGTRQQTYTAGAKRLARALAMPVPRAAKRLLTAAGRDQPIARVAVATPYMLLISWSQSMGEIAGIVAGPGRSATKLH